MKRLLSDSEKKIHIAPDAVVMGDVTVGEGTSIWYHAVIRAEAAPVTIGKGRTERQKRTKATGRR